MPSDLPLAMATTTGLMTIRIGATLRLIPFFGGAPMPLLPWLGLSLAISALLGPSVGPMPDPDRGAVFILALAVKELFIGLFIGAMVRIAFSALEIVGQLAHLSELTPMEGRETGPFSTFYTLLGAGVFLLIGGHHALLTGLASTLRCMPLHAFPGIDVFSGAASQAVIALFAAAMAVGVLAAAPIFTAGLVADLIVGAASRLHHGVAEAGRETLRLLAVRLMIIVSLLLVVSTAVELLQTGIETIALCRKP